MGCVEIDERGERVGRRVRRELEESEVGGD